jgi:hypothetical protein
MPPVAPLGPCPSRHQQLVAGARFHQLPLPRAPPPSESPASDPAAGDSGRISRETAFNIRVHGRWSALGMRPNRAANTEAARKRRERQAVPVITDAKAGTFENPDQALMDALVDRIKNDLGLLNQLRAMVPEPATDERDVQSERPTEPAPPRAPPVPQRPLQALPAPAQALTDEQRTILAYLRRHMEKDGLVQNAPTHIGPRHSHHGPVRGGCSDRRHGPACRYPRLGHHTG